MDVNLFKPHLAMIFFSHLSHGGLAYRMAPSSALVLEHPRLRAALLGIREDPILDIAERNTVYQPCIVAGIGS